MIPKIIHFIWVGPPLPRWAQANIVRWQTLNPGWQVMLHGEGVLSPVYEKIYASIGDMCSRSDLLRLSVLRKYGGWYFDCDFIPFKPVDPLYEKYSIDHTFLTMQWGKHGLKWVANGIFAIERGSPAWQEVDTLVEKAASSALQRCSFGPLLTTQLVERVEIPLSLPKEFYPWRPSRAKCIEKLETVWKQDFAQSAIASLGAGESTAAHLWLGGDYNQPSLDGLVG